MYQISHPFTSLTTCMPYKSLFLLPAHPDRAISEDDELNSKPILSQHLSDISANVETNAVCEGDSKLKEGKQISKAIDDTSGSQSHNVLKSSSKLPSKPSTALISEKKKCDAKPVPYTRTQSCLPTDTSDYTSDSDEGAVSNIKGKLSDKSANLETNVECEGDSNLKGGKHISKALDDTSGNQSHNILKSSSKACGLPSMPVVALISDKKCDATQNHLKPVPYARTQGCLPTDTSDYTSDSEEGESGVASNSKLKLSDKSANLEANAAREGDSDLKGGKQIPKANDDTSHNVLKSSKACRLPSKPSAATQSHLKPTHIKGFLSTDTSDYTSDTDDEDKSIVPPSTTKGASLIPVKAKVSLSRAKRMSKLPRGAIAAESKKTVPCLPLSKSNANSCQAGKAACSNQSVGYQGSKDGTSAHPDNTMLEGQTVQQGVQPNKSSSDNDSDSDSLSLNKQSEVSQEKVQCSDTTRLNDDKATLNSSICTKSLCSGLEKQLSPKQAQQMSTTDVNIMEETQRISETQLGMIYTHTRLIHVVWFLFCAVNFFCIFTTIGSACARHVIYVFDFIFFQIR